MLKKGLQNKEGEKLSGFNLGDALFQLFNLAFIVLIIVLIVSFFRSKKNRRNQLEKIEKKIIDIETQIKKENE